MSNHNFSVCRIYVQRREICIKSILSLGLPILPMSLVINPPLTDLQLYIITSLTCLCPTITSLVAGFTFGAGKFACMYPQWLCESASFSRHAVQFSIFMMHRTLCSRWVSSCRNSFNDVPFKLRPLSTTVRFDNLKQIKSNNLNAVQKIILLNRKTLFQWNASW